MTQAQAIIRVAKGEVGYHEAMSGGHWNNDQKYSDQVPGLKWSDKQPWCQTFVTWCAMKAGIQGLYHPTKTPTASCDIAGSWFKQQGRWSEYPAVGAQVFYGKPSDLSHTGIVYKYDATYVYTIEGNTNATGSREGDGVYLKKRKRRDAYVVGYGYPKFKEGIDSADPKYAKQKPVPPKRPASTAKMQPKSYYIGAKGPAVLWLAQRLITHGYQRFYKNGPDQTFTQGEDRKAVQAFQLDQGWKGTRKGGDADGFPGTETLKRLAADPPKHDATPDTKGFIAKIDGIDISHWQTQRLAFTKIKRAGAKFVCHKITESTGYVDPKWKGRRGPINKAGIVFGGYHFARPAKSSGTAQAKFFLKTVGLKKGDLRPVLDLEDRGGLSTAALTKWAQEFAAECRAQLGCDPILYSNFDLNARVGLLWVARYNNAMELPRTPKPYQKWTMWQFSNGVYGKPNSIDGAGHVDLNAFNTGVTINELIIP